MYPAMLRQAVAAVILAVLPSLSPLVAGSNDPFILSHLGGTSLAVTVEGSTVFAGIGPTVTGLNAVDQPARISFGVLGGEGLVNDVAVVGQTAYVAQRLGGLRIVGLGAGYSESGSSLAGGEKAEGLDAAGGYLYLAVQDYGLRIFDVAVPTSPGLVGSEPKPGGTTWVLDVAVDEDNDCAYVAAGGAGIWAVDVSNRAAPVSGATWDTGNVYAVEVYDGSVYAASGAGGLAVLPIIGRCALGTASFYATAHEARDVSVAGDVAFVAASELYAVDVSGLPTLADLGSCEVPGGAVGVATADGTRAFVAAGSRGVQVARRLSPSAGPTWVGGYDPFSSVYDVVVDGGYAYVAAGDHGLLEVTAGSSGLGIVRSFDGGEFDAHAVAVDSGHIYVGTFHEGSFDGNVIALNRATFLEDSRYPAAGFFAPVNDIETDGSYVYVAASNFDGFTVLTAASAIPSFEFVGDCSAWWDVFGGPQDFSLSLELEGSYAFVGTDLSGVQIVDIQNPAAPTRASSFEAVITLPDVAPYGRYLYARDNYVNSLRVLVLDLGGGAVPADPPTWVNTYVPSAGQANASGCCRGDLERQGATLISLWDTWGLRTTGLGVPTDLQEGFAVDSPMPALCLDAVGSSVYVGLESGGLMVVQFPDPVFADGFESGDTTVWSNSVP
jgi:hypothetical protein